jgi:hypothetical protein
VVEDLLATIEEELESGEEGVACSYGGRISFD